MAQSPLRPRATPGPAVGPGAVGLIVENEPSPAVALTVGLDLAAVNGLPKREVKRIVTLLGAIADRAAGLAEVRFELRAGPGPIAAEFLAAVQARSPEARVTLVSAEPSVAEGDGSGEAHGPGAQDARLRAEIAALRAQIGGLMRRLGAAVEARSERGALVQQLTVMHERAQAAETEAMEARAEMQRMRATLSWRVTTPLRALRLGPRARALALGARARWERLREALATRAANAPAQPRPAVPGQDPEWGEAYLAPTPAREGPPAAALETALVRVVAHYHDARGMLDPSPAEALGDGGEDWLSVVRAKPQYEGHLQPRLPGVLGLYDPRAPEVQIQQARLARAAGIAAFCFTARWRPGEAALDSVAQSWRANPEAGIGYCICWENQVEDEGGGAGDGASLTAVAPPDAGDERAFIDQLEPYLADPRYLRVNGAAVVIVRRPGLLSDAPALAQAWRDAARSRGLGALHLAYLRVGEGDDPALFGFDAAIEHPPYRLEPKERVRRPGTDAPGFLGRVFDYGEAALRASLWRPTGYPIHRGAFAGFDNEPRRPGRGVSFAGASPAGLRDWVAYLARESAARVADPQARLVFLNSWNDWPNGAVLEPDRTYGYEWLHALRDGLVAAERRAAQARSGRLIVVLHAYYLDVFREFLGEIAGLSEVSELVVTCPQDRAEQVLAAARAAGVAAPIKVLGLENRGRDVAPFLEAMERVRFHDDDVILKLHTKKSTHRRDGAEWRQRMVKSLLDQATLQRAMAAFAHDDRIGMIAPEGCIVPITTNLELNRARIDQLIARLGWQGLHHEMDVFVAGTMFLVRARHLKPLLGLGLSADAFEPEAGQVDATLAHALERLFSVAVLRAGASIVEPTPPAADSAWTPELTRGEVEGAGGRRPERWRYR